MIQTLINNSLNPELELIGDFPGIPFYPSP